MGLPRSSAADSRAATPLVAVAAVVTAGMVAALCVLHPSPLSAQPFEGGYPFLMPPGDSTTARFLPAFPARPITDDDFVSAAGDDFHRGGTRIRFFGANFVADAAFPTHGDASFIAPRFRKLGFNLVRFHHLDNAWSDHGIFPRGGSTRTIDEFQRDRLEYLIFKLKREGVYVNMNLHVSRTFTEADGVAGADSIVDFGKGVTFFDPYLIELQKEYARQILTHVNPYTGRRLADDPVLAMVEITNENSLYAMWRSGDLTGFGQGGRLIRRHVELLDDLWTRWLAAKYGATDAVRAAWGADALAEGAEMVQNGGIESGVGGRWQLEFHGGAVAQVSANRSNPRSGALSARVSVTTTGPEDWRVQFKQVGLSIEKDTTYTVRFALRAERPRSVPVGVTKNVDPWTGYGSFTAAVDTEWRDFEFTFTASESVANDIRISFIAGGETGYLWVDDVSMKRAGRAGLDEGETLEDATVRRLPFSDVLKYSTARIHDTTAFYKHLQDAYFEEMTAFLRGQLGVRCPITGTNWNFGLVDLAVQSKLDYVDNHAYWDHPQFPGEPWSSTDWLIDNTAMVGAADGGTIGRLMAGAAPADRPYTISEYNHAFPNRFQTEGVLFLGAYAALHDVDGLMFFDYNGSPDWTRDRISSYFSLHRNSAMMALMPSVAKAYRDGLVAEADLTVTAEYAEADVLGYPALDTGAWGGTWLFPNVLALRHRVVTSTYAAPGGTNVASFPDQPTPPYRSDTREIEWDPDGLLRVDAPGFWAAAGFLDSVPDLEVGVARIAEADGFGVFTWTALDGRDVLGSSRSLMTLTSAAQNTGMTWDGRRTLHDDWGAAPVVLRPLRVVLHISLAVPVSGSSDAFLLVHALDPTGAVTSTRRVDWSSVGFEVVLDQGVDQTPWFGIEATWPSAAEGGAAPERFTFDGIYPNPARGTARLSITLPAAARAGIELFDALGRRVRSRTVVAPPGRSVLDLDVSGLAAGLYHVRVTADGRSEARGLVVR